MVDGVSARKDRLSGVQLTATVAVSLPTGLCSDTLGVTRLLGVSDGINRWNFQAVEQ